MRRRYHQAALQGHAEAQFALAIMHLRGLGVVQSQDEACKWCALGAQVKPTHPPARPPALAGWRSTGSCARSIGGWDGPGRWQV